MPSISLLITFLVLTYAPPHLLSFTPPIASRRILHQPFFPQDSFPPSQPPSPSPPSPQTTSTTTTTTTPKIPFSTSTPNQSPFFPSYPSPPPPPSPASFASFPANISSLILPTSTQPKQNSSKLLIAAITAVISALLVAAILIGFYFRRHRQNRNSNNFGDEKTHSYTSDNNSHRLYPTNAETRNTTTTTTTTHKLRTSSTASSEFLYLGTLVNSRRGGIDDDYNGDSRNDSGFDNRKLDSPELLPLPPLARQNGGNLEEETEEEFYSPRMSLGGRESSSGTGSGSRRLFAGIAGVDRSDSSSCSCSSSSSGSPARSNSVSISPPVSLSPGRSEPKSPELTGVLQVPSPLSSSSERGLERTVDVSPGISDVWYRNVRSPPLSLASTSPDRNLVKEPNASHVLKNWNVVRSPTLSSASISPHRESPRVSNAIVPDVQSPSPNTGGFQKSASESPRISNV